MASAKVVAKDIDLKDLQVELEAIEKEGKTPLVLDRSKRAATFFEFSATCIEAKRLVVELAMKKKTQDETLEALRAKYVAALKHGNKLVINLDNSAPQFKTTLQGPTTFPVEVFDASRARADDIVNAIVREEDKEKGAGVFVVRDGFSVVVISCFEAGIFEEFLTDSIPLEKMSVLAIRQDP
mmetsp:Transcript_15466/g.36554  ORF Transcript_15466/g.36554 Transcript_15466/m.36554 type:complete len:182 (+) Transcript_15466:170-715(+)